MLKGRKLNHIGLACINADAAAKWYAEVLGYETIGTFPDAEGKNVYMMKNGDITYEIYGVSDLAPALQGKIDHIAYSSEDIEADYRYCVEQGYTIATDGIVHLPSMPESFFRYFKILSSTGEEVEICTTHQF